MERLVGMLVLSLVLGAVLGYASREPNWWRTPSTLFRFGFGAGLGMLLAVSMQVIYPVMFDHLFDARNLEHLPMVLRPLGLGALIAMGSSMTIFVWGSFAFVGALFGFRARGHINPLPIIGFAVMLGSFWLINAEQLPRGVHSGTYAFRLSSEGYTPQADGTSKLREEWNHESNEWVKFVTLNWTTGFGYEVYSSRDSKWFIDEEPRPEQPVYVFSKEYFRGKYPGDETVAKCTIKHIGVLNASELRQKLIEINARRCLTDSAK